jgi:hypothetical protein
MTLTTQKAVELIATRKAGLLLGQIRPGNRPYILHSCVIDKPVHNLFGSLTVEGEGCGEGPLHLWILIHTQEIEYIMQNPPDYGDNIGDLIQGFMLN